MRQILRAAVLFCLALPVPGRADVVVELFTSQGCSSCPPADALLGELGKQEGVIALAFHVDYWDYLGWKDTFAKPEHSLRQRAYSSKVDRQWLHRPLRGSFTPEIVVQGTDSLVGSSGQKIIARILDHMSKDEPAKIALVRDGSDLLVGLEPLGESGEATQIMIATFVKAETVEVRRGENAGRTLTYHHVVKSLVRAGEWDGKSQKAFKVSDIEGPVAVFLQKGDAGPILTGASLY